MPSTVAPVVTETIVGKSIMTCCRRSPVCACDKRLKSSVFRTLNPVGREAVQTLLMLSTLGKIFSRQHIELIFLFFPENKF